MIEGAPKLFAASDWALALNRSAVAVRQSLASIEPDDTIEKSGNRCNAWYLTSLPDSWRQEIARAALKRRMTIEQYVDQKTKPWKPPIPLAECLPADIEKAKRLRTAWAPTIDRMRSPALLPGELARLGLRDYQKEFGFVITEKHWNFLHDRLLSRDGGAEQFGRLELYLDDNARRAKLNVEINTPPPAWLNEVSKIIDGFADPRQPKLTEEITLWLRAMDGIKAQIESGVSVAVAKREMTKLLFTRLPAIAKTENALRKQIDRKWRAWESSNGAASAVGDRRGTDSGFWRAPELSDPEFIEIVGYAAHNCGGRISQAWRELRKLARLPQRFLDYYRKPSSKSWVPKRVRDAIRSAVEQEEISSHGPRFAILAGPSIPGEHNYPSMSWYQADDVTLNHMVWFRDKFTGKIEVMRGQVLLMICTRSLRILNFLFLYSKTYNSFSIASLMKETLKEHGAAHDGWGFENGLWKTSRLVTGNQNIREHTYDEAVDLGYRKFGMKFRHSLLPRAKPVERVFGVLQDKMQGYPGYVGRNSRIDRFEEMEKIILDVRAERRDPADYFLHADAWVEVIKEIVLDFNADPLDGEMHRGLTPDEACKAFASDIPRQEFHPAMSCIFNPYVPTTVTRKGVRLKYGKRTFTYLSEELGRMIGQTVLVSFDPADMGQAAIMDLKKDNIHIAKCLEPIPRANATSEQISGSRSEISTFLSTVNGRHVVIKAIKQDERRKLLMDAKTKNHIIDYTTKMSAAREDAAQTRRRETAIEKNAQEAGVILTPAVKARSSAPEAMARLAKAKQAWQESKEDK